MGILSHHSERLKHTTNKRKPMKDSLSRVDKLDNVGKPVRTHARRSEPATDPAVSEAGDFKSCWERAAFFPACQCARPDRHPRWLLLLIYTMYLDEMSTDILLAPERLSCLCQSGRNPSNWT